ncbi:MAG: MFS transporter [Dehalococcoidia bacterium]|nr:MFS transporter [Dehalococcoidia bacterium]
MACALITLVSGSTFYYGFGALFDPIIDEFGWSTTATALAFSLRSEAAAVGSPITGFLVDRFGPRKVMMGGVLTAVLGMLWFSRMDSLFPFYASVFVIALGNSGTDSRIGGLAVSYWFIRRRTRAIAVLTLGIGLSGFVVPAVAWMVSTHGWRAAVVAMAWALLVVAFPLTLLVRDNPERHGLRPDGDPPHPPSTPGTGYQQERSVFTEHDLSLRQAVRGRAFWLLSLAFALSTMGSSAYTVLIIPALLHAGHSHEIAALAAAGVPMLSLPGRAMTGVLGDRFDKRKVVAGTFTVQAVGTLVLAAADAGAPVVLLSLLLFAPGFGAFLPLRTPIQAEQFGLKALGSIQGSILGVATIGGFIGPVFTGAVVDLTGSYGPAFAALSVCLALAAPLVLALPKPALEPWRE